MGYENSIESESTENGGTRVPPLQDDTWPSPVGGTEPPAPEDDDEDED